MAKASSYILALDQGTTSSRALLIDKDGQVKAAAQEEFEQYYPRPGWVEHDPEQIWESQARVMRRVAEKLQSGETVAGIGITNQRETTLLWDRRSGKPIHRAIVWQDRRTAELCERWKSQGFGGKVQDKTGLIIDAYFSASKIRWLLDEVPGAKQAAEQGQLAFGTIDSWLIWKLSKGRLHLTDVTNASRTMLFNIKTGSWDSELLELFGIPRSLLPEVRSCSEIYGSVEKDILGFEAPIAGVAGDQHAALFGQLCLEEGMIKNTYGTGCFLMLNIGPNPKASKNKLLTTVAWEIGGQKTYALEGSVFIGGAAVQWLRDGLGIIKHSKEVETLAAHVSDNGGVYFVPAFTGMGAPYWDPYARGMIIGLTRGTTREHIARATLEAIAFQTRDLIEAMRADANIPLKELRVDGGASINPQLMQFQADLLAAKVVRPKQLESTALGAAYFAGLACQFFESPEALRRLWQRDASYDPKMDLRERARLYKMWQSAVQHAAGWARDE